MSTTEATRATPGAGKAQTEAAPEAPKITYGRNGVPITPGGVTGHGFRTYEIHQRERLGQSTAKIKPAQLISPEFIRNPYPILDILRENYPSYRDWLENSYWITRYDDVTSIFTDDANFETRPRRWFYNIADYGRDLRLELPVLFAQRAPPPVSPTQALRIWTLGGAYATFEESQKGSITVGKFADFVILDTDIMRVPAEMVMKTKVLSTWVGGKAVFEAR